MDRLNDLLLAGKIRAEHGLDAFLSEERGDTNFISMLIIIAIAVFLGGLFKAMGQNILDTVQNKVAQFVNGL
ncbi:hypothetical protein HMPREF1986_00503 [Oribacterium sp. oral taxon 078 str. F0263]|uniref:hypothetical protein n=1 Tax=Oribacterium sp. oral taxon 078 TaxID=652706 RepID=UPI0003AE0408|nr:hypothetical protein [Oribacterium sp. oral taxon 078]ERL22534.1 hypothetical protein HMPREF1986_00503 [Oribacterium sp. oral taxon 078 str. F0263]